MIGVDNNMLGVTMRSIFGMASPCVHDIAGGLYRTYTDGVDHSRIIERVECEVFSDGDQRTSVADASGLGEVEIQHVVVLPNR